MPEDKPGFLRQVKDTLSNAALDNRLHLCPLPFPKLGSTTEN